jgi:hypothetical protein
MSQKTLERLEYLRKANRNRWWINHDLYRLMYKEDLYIIAYERIKSKPGNMTPGTDEETLDGFSLGTIREIIQEMRTEQFSFKPVRQQFIPKPNGKMRKLGIPIVRSYCPPYRMLSGFVASDGSDLPTHAHSSISTVPYFARADESLVVSSVAERAYAVLR